MIILIADDERPSRGQLRYILEGLVPQATIDEARNGKETLALLQQKPIDVLFLDINMPGMDGLTLAALIMQQAEPPLIVFATAYNQHAVRAFELAALDYVVKPFTHKRLSQTIARIQQTLAEQKQLLAQQRLIRNYLESEPSAPALTQLWAKRPNGNRVLVDYDEIAYFEAKDKKVYLQTNSGQQLRLRKSLKELESQLNAHHFCRVHKAFLVNLRYIGEIIPWFAGSYQIRLKDSQGSTIPVSRRYAAQLKKRTKWI